MWNHFPCFSRSSTRPYQPTPQAIQEPTRLPRTPAATISNMVKRPSETSNPANSMIASLEVGMQALSRSINPKIPASPRSPITFVAKSTIGSVSEAV